MNIKKWLTRNVSLSWLKVLLSFIAISAITLRLIWPNLKIDSVTLGLIVLALLPWFSEIIETLKLPGGWEVKFRDMQKAGEKIAEQLPSASPPPPSSVAPSLAESDEPAYLLIADKDANLALAGLRIEIEKRLRLLAGKNQLPDRTSLTQMLRLLQQKEVLTPSALSGLQELIYAGNQAAHGARIEAGVADWAISYGPVVLDTLDRLIQNR